MAYLTPAEAHRHRLVYRKHMTTPAEVIRKVETQNSRGQTTVVDQSMGIIMGYKFPANLGLEDEVAAQLQGRPYSWFQYDPTWAEGFVAGLELQLTDQLKIGDVLYEIASVDDPGSEVIVRQSRIWRTQV
jgi:hypothetical protein